MKRFSILLFIFFISSAQTISVYRVDSNEKLRTFEDAILNNVVQTINKKRADKIKLEFSNLNSVQRIKKAVKVNENTVIFNSHLLKNKSNFDISKNYTPTEYFLYTTKNSEIENGWNNSYKRVGFTMNTVEEYLFSSLQKDGRFIGVPLRNCDEKRSMLKNKKVDFIIDNSIAVGNSFIPFHNLNDSKFNGLSVLLSKNNSLMKLVYDQLNQYLTSNKYRKVLLEFLNSYSHYKTENKSFASK